MIRRAAVRDVPVISSLIRDAFRDVAARFGLTPDNCPNHPSNCTDEWIRSDIGRGVNYFLLEYSGAPAGCVGFEMAEDQLAYLERLSVLPSQRRKGFGTALVRQAITRARDAGARKISAAIIANHVELKRWYEKLGFVEGETREFGHLPFRVTFLAYTLQEASANNRAKRTGKCWPPTH